jgi:hypothetical protein
LRRQKTDEFAALSRRSRDEKPIARFGCLLSSEPYRSVFPSHPARQRRKLFCLLFSIFCPLNPIAWFFHLIRRDSAASSSVFCPLSSIF